MFIPCNHGPTSEPDVVFTDDPDVEEHDEDNKAGGLFKRWMDATSKIDFTPMRLPSSSGPRTTTPSLGLTPAATRPSLPSGRIYHSAHAPSGCLGGDVASPLVAPGCGGVQQSETNWLHAPPTPLAMDTWEANGISIGAVLAEGDVSMTPPPTAALSGSTSTALQQRQGGDAFDCATEMSVDLVSSAVSRLQLRERHVAS